MLLLNYYKLALSLVFCITACTGGHAHSQCTIAAQAPPCPCSPVCNAWLPGTAHACFTITSSV
jgi:hypothetical protein